MFAKVFEQIFESSIAEDYHTRHVFMDLLVLADEEGVIDKTLGSISRITNVPQRVIRKAIDTLCSPDRNSRTPADEGRRLVLIDEHRDWGWKIVNYLKYRQIRDEEARRASNRSYKRAQRVRDTSDQKPDSQQCQPVSAHTEAEVEVDTEVKSKPSRDLSDEVLEIAKFHPKIAHRKKGLSRMEEEVIAQAIAQDGRDLVLSGTRNLADAVAKWPINEHKFAPDPVKFYQQEQYRKPPEYWERKADSNGKPNTTGRLQNHREDVQRYEKNADLIYDGKD